MARYFKGLSARRKTLFVLLLVVFVLMGLLSWMGVAGFRSTPVEDMDWNADGQVSRSEILQGFTVIVVSETTEGRRVCRYYARMRDRDEPIRVDCRTEAAASPDTD